jgi:hypothetical protein
MSIQLDIWKKRAALISKEEKQEQLKESSKDPSGHSTKFDPTETHKVGKYTVKHTQTEHDEPDRSDEASIYVTHHYDIHHNGKKVGTIEKHYNDYMGHHSKIYNKQGMRVDYHRGGISAHNHLGKLLGSKKEHYLNEESLQLSEKIDSSELITEA